MNVKAFLCPHNLDLRKYPRCYLCRPLGPAETLVVRTYPGPIGSGSTTSTPWCGICGGWHIPGAGACTANYS